MWGIGEGGGRKEREERGGKKGGGKETGGVSRGKDKDNGEEEIRTRTD